MIGSPIDAARVACFDFSGAEVHGIFSLSFCKGRGPIFSLDGLSRCHNRLAGFALGGVSSTPQGLGLDGGSGFRTRDIRLSRPVLYPTELAPHLNSPFSHPFVKRLAVLCESSDFTRFNQTLQNGMNDGDRTTVLLNRKSVLDKVRLNAFRREASPWISHQDITNGIRDSENVFFIELFVQHSAESGNGLLNCGNLALDLVLLVGEFREFLLRGAQCRLERLLVHSRSLYNYVTHQNRAKLTQNTYT